MLLNDTLQMRSRANEAVVMLWRALGARSAPKLTRHTGVGNGLSNCFPSGI